MKTLLATIMTWLGGNLMTAVRGLVAVLIVFLSYWGGLWVCLVVAFLTLPLVSRWEYRSYYAKGGGP